MFYLDLISHLTAVCLLIFIFPENHFYPVFPIWATECKVSFVFLPTSCLYVTCFHVANFHDKRCILVVTNCSTSFLVFFSNITIMSSVSP